MGILLFLAIIAWVWMDAFVMISWWTKPYGHGGQGLDFKLNDSVIILLGLPVWPIFAIGLTCWSIKNPVLVRGKEKP